MLALNKMLRVMVSKGHPNDLTETINASRNHVDLWLALTRLHRCDVTSETARGLSRPGDLACAVVPDAQEGQGSAHKRRISIFGSSEFGVVSGLDLGVSFRDVAEGDFDVPAPSAFNNEFDTSECKHLDCRPMLAFSSLS